LVGDEEWEEFERAVRMKWETRQEELKKIEEEYLADAPALLRDRIEALEGYIVSPMEHLQHILRDGESNGNHDDEEDEEEDRDILWVLDDLDYQLMDIDMARDFHTMGGWPLLVSLLTDPIHGINDTYALSPKSSNSTYTPSAIADRDKLELVWRIQGLASLAIGSAVRNVAEFNSWALEDFDDLVTTNGDGADERETNVKKTNVVSILSSKLISYMSDSSAVTPWQDDDLFLKKIYRELHALGALLRGNRLAIYHFTSNLNGGPSLSRLADSILRYHLLKHDNAQEDTEDGDSKRNGIYTERLILRIVTLAQDIVMDVTLHPYMESFVDGNPEMMDKITINSFTTEEWCSIPLLGLITPSSLFSGRMKSDFFKTVVAMAPYCTYKRDDFDYNSILTAVMDSGEDADFEDTWSRLMEVLK